MGTAGLEPMQMPSAAPIAISGKPIAVTALTPLASSGSEVIVVCRTTPTQRGRPTRSCLR